MAARPRRSYRDLSLQQLRSFVAVCREGSYAAAARTLHLTGPAVWEQLQALERYFEKRLFERCGNGVRATAQGTRLLALILPVLAGIDSAKAVLHQETGELPHTLTFVTHLRVLAAEISAALRRFQRQAPTVQLKIAYTGTEEPAARMINETADLAFVLEPEPPDAHARVLTFEPAGELDFLLVAPAEHALMRRRRLNLRAIVGHPLILGELATYSRRRVDTIFRREHLIGKVQVAVETSSDEYTVGCVQAGMGVGITMGQAHGGLYRNVGVRCVTRWFGTGRVGFLWRRGAHVPPAERRLAQIIAGCLRPPRGPGREVPQHRDIAS